MTEKNSLVFVTGNANKAAEAIEIWAPLGVRIKPMSADAPEIQSYSLEEIVRAKAQSAFSLLGVPLVVEDVSLDVSALGGFPGPFVKFWQNGPGYDKICKIVKAMGDDVAIARCGMAYTDGSCTLYVEGDCKGRFVTRRGDKAFGFDPYFVPTHPANLPIPRTFAEMGKETKNKVSHRATAIRLMHRILCEERVIDRVEWVATDMGD